MLAQEDFLIAAASVLLLFGIGGVLVDVSRSSPIDNENIVYANSELDASNVLNTYNTSDSGISYISNAHSCLDSRWKTEVNGQNRKCKWIAQNSMESCYNSEEVRAHCPLTCNACSPDLCRDVSGEFEMAGAYITCSETHYCANPIFEDNCRVSCKKCTNSTTTSPPSLRPPSIAPSTIPPLPSTTSPHSLSSVPTQDKSWISVGNPFYGGTKDNSGLAVSLSNDGETLFVGEPGYGIVRSFTHDFQTSNPGGSTIGNAYDPWFGSSVASSHDGSVVAISSYKYDNYRGLVRVFIWDGLRWIKLGNDLLGDEVGQWFGWGVDVSKDGKSIIVGSYLENSSLGYARVFDIDSSGWKKRGEDLVGNGEGAFGFSVAISSDGNIAAIGAPKGSYTYVYEWVSTQWSPLGDRINGSIGANFGNNIALSCKDGLVLAIGANHEINGRGAVYVYEWKKLTSEWQLRGTDAAVYGTNPSDFVGGRISISEDGNIVAYNSRAKVGVLVWDGVVWREQGNIITEGLTSIALSGDGKTLAVGRPHDDTVDFRAGVTDIFRWQ